MAGYCQQLLATGACQTKDCTLNHDVHICRPCGVVCFSTRVYQSHLSGKRHRNRESGRATIVHCLVCGINMSGTSWTPHVRGKRHSRAAASQGVSPDVEPEEEAVKPGHTFCNVCARTLPQSKWNNHLTTPQHVRRMLFANYEAAFEEAEKNKHGTTVSHDDDGVNFGITEVPNAQQGVQIIVKIQNTVPLAHITLVDAQLALKSHRGTPP